MPPGANLTPAGNLRNWTVEDFRTVFSTGRTPEGKQLNPAQMPWSVIGQAHPEEIEYWKNHDTLSFVLLVGCVEDWARRNQPGLMVTAGTPTLIVQSHRFATRPPRPAFGEGEAGIGLLEVPHQAAAASGCVAGTVGGVVGEVGAEPFA